MATTLWIPFLTFRGFCTFPVSPDFWVRWLRYLHVIVFLHPFRRDLSSNPESAFFGKLWVGFCHRLRASLPALKMVFLEALGALGDLTRMSLTTRETQASVCSSDQRGLGLAFPECPLARRVTGSPLKGGTAPQTCSSLYM